MAGQRPTTAIVPAAGLGTRLRPLTDAVPKEMLNLGRMPVIGHVLREIREAGIHSVVVVISPSKEAIPAYVGDGSPWGLSVSYAVQPSMRGVGDAILTGLQSSWEPVLAAFGDCAVLRLEASNQPLPAQRLVEAFISREAHAAVLCEQVAPERVCHYGVLDPCDGSVSETDEPFLIRGIVEKPEPAAAPSRWVVAARWILGPEAIAILRNQPPGKNGEVGVTEAVARLLGDGGRVVAVPLLPCEKRCDVGNWRSLLGAQALAALADPEWGEAIRAETEAMR